MRESFNELMNTSLDFSAFVINWLKVDTLTPELLAGPTFELMKGSCKSLVELEYFFEEVYKATTDQLDWNNPEGQQSPHDLRKPLPLIPNSQGRRVIPFDRFINNGLVYLSGGVSSRTYTTSVTKTKAADYGHIKWIEDLVPNTMWSQVINDVTKLQIVEWHNYKHLDWITVCRDDDKLYIFKEGDFNRLRIQDIEDMLLLLVQGKLTNLTVEECLAFNKLNLTKPDTYKLDLKGREAYTAYSNPRGFIYQNKDKKNRLMRIDELHKFSDGTLNDFRTALDDRLKGIQMKYLPQTIWRQRDRDKAGAMIQAIDKQLKTRRIMRSLEKFVGGRPYEAIRMASTAAKSCQGDSSEFYLITGSIYTDQRGTVVLPTIGAADSRLKPTAHVFTEVGFKWKPTSRTFTIVGNSCPLTRITSANVVPSKKTTSDSVETQKLELKVYSRKPKNVKNVGLSKKAKIIESKNANHSEPNHTWGSKATDIPSSSSLGMTVRFGNDNIAKIMGYGDY
ncbi:hypothetical protein Tco_1523565 [Tanacetum coccineum]